MRTGFKLAILLCCAAITAASAPAPIRTLDGRALSPAAVDALVAQQMAANKITGMGVALIRHGRVVFAKSYGERDAAHRPLQNDTVIYGASLTKATFATYVMQLVGEGKLDLDTPIEHYLAKPLPAYEDYADLAGDERWRKLTLRILLDHTTGFANLRHFDGDKLRFHRDPGARFGYSGEGMLLAQFVIEQHLGLDTAAEMQRRLFDPLGMTRTSMTWQERFADNWSMMFPEGVPPRGQKMRKRAGAAGSLVTTLDDWSRFLAAVVRGDLLTPAARAAMVRTSVLIDSPAEFPTLDDARTDKWRGIRLGYAVGWGTFETPYGHAFFKEGHDDGSSNYALCVDKRGDCILMLANDNGAEGAFATLVDRLFGPVGLPWQWEGFAPPALHLNAP